MKDLITEARELCEKAAPGLWQVKLHSEDYGQGYGEITNFVDMGSTLLKIGIADTAEKYTEYSTFSTFIARSRALISELCDALEKAEDEKQREFDIATGYYNKWQKALSEIDRLTAENAKLTERLEAIKQDMAMIECSDLCTVCEFRKSEVVDLVCGGCEGRNVCVGEFVWRGEESK